MHIDLNVTEDITVKLNTTKENPVFWQQFGSVYLATRTSYWYICI